MDSPIFQITHDVLTDDILMSHMRKDIDCTYYWSDDWSPEFYSALAREGFITITLEHAEVGTLLLPELQKSYAVLDWENLHISRKLKKLVRTVPEKDVHLMISYDTLPVFEEINRQFGENCWMTDKYLSLLQTVQEKHYLQLFSVELRIEGELLAGEIGYVIGATYTSLSGFAHRDKQCYGGVGTLQLVLLAKLLEKLGFAFWNMGHPQLQYKMDLGAEVFQRRQFLRRWDKVLAYNTTPLEPKAYSLKELWRIK